jgi:hypothetical protein
MAIATTSITVRNNDGSGTWVEYGTQSSSQNTDIFLTSTGSRAKKVSNSTKGFAFQINAAGEDVTATGTNGTLCFAIRWTVTAGVGSLQTRTSGGVALAVQDTSGNTSYWDLDGNDTYTGGWKVSVVDMSTTPSRNSGTAASLTAVQYVGLVWITTANVGGGDPNCYIDQILSWPASGIVVTGNTTALFDDLVDVIDDDATNGPFGVIERRAGVVFSKARLVFQQDATDMSETDRTLILENPVYDAGSTIDSCLAEIGVENDNATAGELFTLTRCSVISADPDETVTTDANREFDFTVADNATFDTCLIAGFSGTVMHLGDTTNTYDDCTFQRCSQIEDSGAAVRRGFVRDTTETATATAAALLWTSSSDWEDTAFFMGASVSHAIEIESSITDTWTGFTFNGYATTDGTDGDEVLLNNSNGIDYTISGVSVTGTVSIRQAGTSTATFSASVSVTITVVDTAGDPIQGARVFLEEDPGGTDVISYDTTNASGAVTASYAGGTPQAVTGFVRKGTVSPVYKAVPINDTIGASGLDAVITMVSDE